MPNCFQLFKKGSAEAVVLNKVDEELCALLDIPVDPEMYVIGWFDCIGWYIAMGKPLGSQELRDKINSFPVKDKLLKCLDYLEEHYTSDAWSELKSHPKRVKS